MCQRRLGHSRALGPPFGLILGASISRASPIPILFAGRDVRDDGCRGPCLLGANSGGSGKHHPAGSERHVKLGYGTPRRSGEPALQRKWRSKLFTGRSKRQLHIDLDAFATAGGDVDRQFNGYRREIAAGARDARQVDRAFSVIPDVPTHPRRTGGQRQHVCDQHSDSW